MARRKVKMPYEKINWEIFEKFEYEITEKGAE